MPTAAYEPRLLCEPTEQEMPLEIILVVSGPKDSSRSFRQNHRLVTGMGRTSG